MIERIDALNEKVEDILLYARPKPPQVQPVNVQALLNDVATSARMTSRREREIPILGDGATAKADPEMLRAALLNITLNACQAAGAADVDIHVWSASGVCRIAVRDRGPGIPASIRDDLFEPFVTSRPNGTGLGLAIAKRMLELQDGHITLADYPDGGTIVEVTLPLL